MFRLCGRDEMYFLVHVYLFFSAGQQESVSITIKFVASTCIKCLAASVPGLPLAGSGDLIHHD